MRQACRQPHEAGPVDIDLQEMGTTEGAAPTEHVTEQPDQEAVPLGEQYGAKLPSARQKALIDGIVRNYEPVLRELGQR